MAGSYPKVIEVEFLKLRIEALNLEVIFYPATPFEEPRIEKKLVKLEDTTQIVKRVEKYPEEFSKEVKSYTKTIEENPETEIFFPESFKEIEISFSNLKIGDEITVEAEETIGGKEFTAKKIILQFTP